MLVPVEIKGTSSLTPGSALSTEEVAERIGGARSAADLYKATGIRTRYHTDPAPKLATTLGAEALRLALERAGVSADELEQLIFVSSHGGDQLIPATATRVLEQLGLPQAKAEAFDLNNACMGFLSAFDVAARAVATGKRPVGIVVVELLSAYLTPEDPRPYAVLGDGVAAAVVDRPHREGAGIIGHASGTLPEITGALLEHPGLSSQRETIRFLATHRRLHELAVNAIVGRTHEALDMAQVSLDEVDWFVPHQPNGRMYDAFLRALEVDADRTVPIVEEIGSVGAASIPMSLDRLMRTREVRPGQVVVFAGVGAGGSTGATVLRM